MRLMRIVITSIITTLQLLLLTTCLLDMELSIPEYSLTLTSLSGFSSPNIDIQCSFTADEDVHRCRYTITKADGTYTKEYEDDFLAGQINQLPIDPVPGEGEYNLEFAVLTYRNGNYEILSFLVKEISFWVDFVYPDAPTVDPPGGQHTGPQSVTISFTLATPPYESPVRLYYYVRNKPTAGIWNYVSSSTTTPITIDITEDTVLRVRVIDQAGNASEIIEIYYIGTTPGADLLARWTLDTLDGGVWPEDSGNVLYEGANRNATLFSDPDPDRGYVASFNPTDLADIEIDSNPAFNLPQDYTLCGWYWMQNTPNPIATIFSKADNTGAIQNWWIYADNFGFLTWAWTNAGIGSSLSYAEDHRDSAWHHFAAVAVSTPAAHILYIDGVQKAISTNTAATDIPDNALYIGSRIDTSVNTNFWDGKLDDLRIYNRGLSHVEIYELFRGNDDSWP